MIAALVATSTGTAHAQQNEPIILDSLLRCAPAVDHGIMAGIISRETSTSPYQTVSETASQLWQINDNTARESTTFPTYQIAVAETTDLVYRQHHTVAIGIGQILSDNVSAYHVSIADAFLPCTNLSLGQAVLAWAYTYAVTKLGVRPGLSATHVALQIYYAGIRDRRYALADAVQYADDVMERAARFNAYYRAPLPTLASLPPPEHPWPRGANAIPIAAPATTAASAPTASPSSTDLDQRRLNALFRE
jgi:hypothetical protein